MSRFLSRRLGGLIPYVPGEQPQDTQYIKLNTNESPFPPSPRVIRAINDTEVSDLRLYSDPECRQCVKAIAEYCGVKPENVVLGNGSDEILSFIFSAFCDKSVPIAFPDISYGFYSVFAQLYGLDTKVVPLREDFTIDPRDYENMGCTVVIANPNAPTGIALSLDDIRLIVGSNPDNIVCIDEAYVDFGAESAISLLSEFDNLIVVQTFSKSRQLAGARLGFAVAGEEIIRDMNTLRFSTNPYNINRLTLLAGKASVEDVSYFEKTRKTIIENRSYTVSELEKRGFAVLPSSANFIFASHPGTDGAYLYRELKNNGVLVRHFDSDRIKDYLRITIGTAEQMNTLIEKLDLILRG